MPNLTLSIDPDTLKQARLYAVHHDTSVNALVRNYLQSLSDRAEEVSEVRPAVSSLERLAQKIKDERSISAEWQWNRDEIYEDRLARREPL